MKFTTLAIPNADDLIFGSAPNHYQAGVAAGRCAIESIRHGVEAGLLKIPARESAFVDTISEQLDALPADEAEFISQQKDLVDAAKYLPAEYGV